MTCILITGSGTLGTALAIALATDGHKIRTLSRSEEKRLKLRNAIPAHLKGNVSVLAGDVCDAERLEIALRGVEQVIHTAALKRIDDCEYDPVEAVRVNVMGTRTLMSACIKMDVQKALLISTDKACAPSTLYGATKLCDERMWLCGKAYGEHPPEFIAVRYGNVFGSAGSVIHAFDGQAITGRLTLTDPTATRFHITLSQAVVLVMRALKYAQPGELYIPKLPSYRLGDLASAYMTERSIKNDPEIIGLRPSEKQHEELIGHNESTAAKDAGEEYILDPSKVFCNKRWSYSSGRNTMLGIPALRKLIRDGA